ncbi:MAG TPA: hypothetical protein VGD01_08290 [Candidatus Elarobacter sp.]
MGARRDVSVPATDRAALLDDVGRAAAWLSGVRALAHDAGAGAETWCALALGLSVAAALLDADGVRRDAAGAAARLARTLAAEPDAAVRDRLPFGLTGALHPAEPPLRAARDALRAAARATDGVGAGPDACAVALRGAEPELAALCERAELRGVAGPARERRELGLALAARAFSAARAPVKSVFAMALLRVAAGAQLDAFVTREALEFVRRQQRVDGSYGHLPPRSRAAGDIRLAVHLPWTVAALRVLHDALAPVPLARSLVLETAEG